MPYKKCTILTAGEELFRFGALRNNFVHIKGEVLFYFEVEVGLEFTAPVVLIEPRFYFVHV